jgi:Fe-S-cluster containining protein
MNDKDARRLGKLVGDLSSDPGYATGARKFPRPVSLDDAVTIANGLQSEVDGGVEARAAAVTANGDVIACTRGCNGCCEEPIMVFRPEAVQVARWLDRPENAEVRDAFLAAYPAWKQRTGDTSARLSELFDGDADRYLEVHVAGWAKGVMCAFNRNGDCSVYPVRPITCRNGHALTTSERCRAPTPAPAVRATFVPLDDFIERTRWLLAAAHNAIGGGPKGRVEALCDVVHELLMKSRGKRK